MTAASHRRTTGLTLIDVLVSLTIVGILLAITLPAVQMAREASRRLSCQSQLRQMGIALHSFQSAHGKFPAGAVAAIGPRSMAFDPDEVEVEDNPGRCTDHASWTVGCLPFLDEMALADQYDSASPWSSLANRDVVETYLGIFGCPSATDPGRVDQHHVRGAAATDYGAIAQVDRGVYTDLFGTPDPGIAARQGILAERQSTSPQQISDGLSNTLMLAECAGRPTAYVLRSQMSASQFARYSEDEIVQVAGQLVVDDGVGWADPDSGFGVEGVTEDGVELYGLRMINGTNAGEVYSFHPSGALCLAADGSVRFLDEQIDAWLFIALCTRAGGEVSSSR